MAHHWRQCAATGCQVIFDAQSPADLYHSRECKRRAQHLTGPSGINADLIREFLEQPEVTDPKAIERALLRVLKRM